MKIAILVSGGLDSAVCLSRYSKIRDVVAVTIDYGQPHHQELGAAGRLCSLYNVPQHRVTVSNAFVPGVGLWGDNLEDAHSTVIPHRNALFITIAAAATGAEVVVIGCNKDDFAAYYDCRHDYIQRLSEALGVKVIAPLHNKTKKQVYSEAMEAGVPVQATVSCYRGTSCGTCAACVQRGFIAE